MSYLKQETEPYREPSVEAAIAAGATKHMMAAVAERHPENDMRPLDAELYATAPVEEMFDWPRNVALLDLPSGTYYLVVFRSHLRDGADQEKLKALDSGAHLEAMGLSGYKGYFAGKPNSEGRAASLCIWETQVEARAAAESDEHRSAMGLKDEAYQSYRLEKYQLHVQRGSSISVQIEPLDDD